MSPDWQFRPKQRSLPKQTEGNGKTGPDLKQSVNFLWISLYSSIYQFVTVVKMLLDIKWLVGDFTTFVCRWLYVISHCKKETIKSVNFYNLKLIEKFDGNLQMEVLIRYWIYFPKLLQYPCCKQNKQYVKDLQSFTEI